MNQWIVKLFENSILIKSYFIILEVGLSYGEASKLTNG